MSFGHVVYEIPPSLYKKISVKAGLSPAAGEESEVVFRIIDAKTPPVYRDAHNVIVDYGGAVLYESRTMAENDSCVNIEADLNEAGIITLSVECTGKNKKTHAVWGEPVLLK